MLREYEDILIDRVGKERQIARITLNRPHKLNALTTALFADLASALRYLEADDSARVVVIRGAGRAFSTGYDLSAGDLDTTPAVPSCRYRLEDDQGRPLLINHQTNIRQITEVQLYLWGMAKVTIVQAHGYCIAGGCELAMMADLITASQDCVFGHPGHRSLGVARNGLIWPLVIGMRKAKELFYTGDSLTGEEAASMGMINYAWAADELESNTLALAERIAIQSADWLAGLKSTINRFYENMGLYSSLRSATEMDAAIQLTAQRYAFAEKLTTDGLQASFAWRNSPYGDYGSAKTEQSRE